MRHRLANGGGGDDLVEKSSRVKSVMLLFVLTSSHFLMQIKCGSSQYPERSICITVFYLFFNLVAKFLNTTGVFARASILVWEKRGQTLGGK
jgi:hypothetical protein